MSQTWHTGDAARVAIPSRTGRPRIRTITLGAELTKAEMTKEHRLMVGAKGGTWYWAHPLGSSTRFAVHTSELYPRGV